MSNTNFTYFYKQKFTSVNDINVIQYDLFVSTFNNSERVTEVFQSVNSKNKIWFVLPEYIGHLYTSSNNIKVVEIQYDGYSQIIQFIDSIDWINVQKVCIDITGFIIPHMLFFLRCLQKSKRVKQIDVIYSEPKKYINEENTDFSDYFHEVVQINGYGGMPSPNMDNDLLIIASGYDDSRIVDVANKKRGAKKIQLFGFPPLQADMFQENFLKAYRAEAAVGNEGFKNLDLNIYAPANDPFESAQAICNFISKENRCKMINNIYLAPMSTKPHALGMGLYYMWENPDGEKPISIIYPLCDRYFGDTSIGLSRIWIYDIEFPE